MSEQARERERPSPLRRPLFWLIGVPLALLLLIALVASIAITTETGLSTLLGLANRFAPGQLSYDKLNGSLWGPLQVEGLRYEDGPLKLKLDRADLDWSPGDLLDRQLNISRLHFEGLELRLPPGEQTPASSEPFVLPDLQLPVGVNIDDLQGRDIRIVPPVGDPIQLDAVKLKARSDAEDLNIESLEVKSPLGEARVSGRVNPTGNYPLDLELNWQAPLEPYGVFNGQGTVKGELRERLSFDQRVTGPADIKLTLNGEVRQPLGEAAWSVKTDLNAPELKPFVPALAGKPLTAQVEAQGVMARFNGKGEIKTVAPELGPTTVQFAATGDPKAITLSELRVSAPDYPLNFTAQGDVQLSPDQLGRFNAKGELNATAPQLGPTTGHFVASGDLKAITLSELRVSAPDYPLNLTAQGDVKLTQDALGRFNAKGELNANAPEIGPAVVRFSASGDPKQVKLDELRLTSPGAPLTLTAQGTVQLPELRFNADGQWQSLTWPLRGVPQVESAKGNFSAEGTPKDYRFELTAEGVQGPNVPKGRWTLSGQGSDQGVRDVKLVGDVLQGSLQAAADATWAPAVGWRATVNGQGLNPGAHWKDVPGKLNFQLKTDGGLENNALRANLLLEQLNGTLSGQRVSGAGDLSLQGQNLTVRALRVNAGDARLEASGALAERWDLAWTLDVPQLKSLVPGVSGTVASSGKLTGSRDQPAVAANFTVRDLRQGDTRVQQLRGDLNLDVGGASRSRLNVTGQGLSLGGQHWKNLRLDGAGTPAAHELTAQLSGDPGNFQLALAGGLQQPAMLWQGRVTQLSAKDTPVGNWTLEQPAALRASAKDASLETACLSSAPSRLCLQGQWRQSGDFNGRAQLSKLNPERFKRFLPAGASLTTSIDGEATASGKIGGALQAKLNVNVAPGSVTTQADGRPVRIAFNGGNAQLDATQQTAAARVRLDLGQTGQLQANLQVQDPLGAARLNGKVDAAVTDLTLVKAFVPQITEISGQVRANVAIGGTASNPVVQGDVRLQNAAATLPEAGLQLKNIQFAAVSAGRGPVQLQGSVDSEPGQLQVAGQLDPAKLQLTLAVTGENFQAIKSTNVQVQISPDLKLDLTPQLARVEGEVTIPRAFIRPGGERPGVVNPSGDAVIVRDQDGKVPEAKGGGMAIFADVRVVLGQEVFLETPAFKGKLQGDLRVVETPQLAPRGSGNIEVVAGKYKIYGEEIEIQRGQLLFSSSPLDNPALDLRVVRQERDIISGNEIMAGAQIRGTVKRPKLSFFSTPTMSDPDTLAYLVLGRAPGGGGAESAMLFKAASALGAGQTGGVTNSLSDAFGLDSAELGSSSGGGTSFMVGKNLTPRLYVGYGIGLLNAVNTFFLKYRFTKHLMLESASNILGTGGDAVYTIER